MKYRKSSVHRSSGELQFALLALHFECRVPKCSNNSCQIITFKTEYKKNEFGNPGTKYESILWEKIKWAFDSHEKSSH